jgi:membrane protein YdbS with pleckstrin-like domain
LILREPANALDPRMRAYWTAQSAIAATFAAVLAALVVGFTAIAGDSTAAWIAAGVGLLVVVAVGVSAFVTPRLDYRHYRYEVTELGLYVARGWLWRRWQIVPHARVQTVDTTAGPLLRAFGLVAVAVTTASAAGSTSIPGLRPDVADALVAELARRAELEEGT